MFGSVDIDDDAGGNYLNPSISPRRTGPDQRGINFGSLNIPTWFHLLDNLAGYILPNFVSAFGVFMMTSFYRSFPKELEEAVILDGATR